MIRNFNLTEGQVARLRERFLQSDLQEAGRISGPEIRNKEKCLCKESGVHQESIRDQSQTD